jgi:hypothetical protein
VSTLAAIARFPEEFDDVKCLVSPQPITPRYIAKRRLEVLGISDRLDDFNTLLRLRTSVGLERRVPQEWAKSVRIPTFLYQVHDDILTEPEDVQAMYDNIPVAEKKLQWIEGTISRWDGYLDFQRRRRPCSTGSRGTCPELNGFEARRAVELLAGQAERGSVVLYPALNKRLKPCSRSPCVSQCEFASARRHEAPRCRAALA